MKIVLLLSYGTAKFATVATRTFTALAEMIVVRHLATLLFSAMFVTLLILLTQLAVKFALQFGDHQHHLHQQKIRTTTTITTTLQILLFVPSRSGNAPGVVNLNIMFRHRASLLEFGAKSAVV